MATDDLYFFEDFPIGGEFPLDPYPVTREAVIEFASEFDPQGIHLDDEIAEASILGALAASGWHTCSIMMRMICDSFIHKTASLGAASVEEVRWLKPVFPGNTLSGTARVLEKRVSASRPHVGIITIQYELFNEAGEKVMTARTPGFMRLREVA